VEERARNELGLIKPDEKFYQVVPPPPQNNQNGNNGEG
jgi:cell division protein FtsB